MTWLKRKSHRSSAPPNGQGRDGARPPHPAAAVPHVGPAVVRQDAGEAPAARVSEPASDPAEARDQESETGAVVPGPWPGTEDRSAGPPDPAPAPDPAAPDPGVPSYGPLGAGPPPDGDRPIWAPRPPHPPRQADESAAERRRRAWSGPQTARKPRRGGPSGPDDAATRPDGTAPLYVPGQSPGPEGPVPDPVPDGPASDGPEPSPSGAARFARRLRLADLAADSRMRIWKRRVLIAIVAGLVFTFIFTWRTGLTAAVLAAIADAVYRSRTTASIPPGVHLSGAQKHTQRQLAHMERAGYRALHSRPIPGSREFIDHFVVGPTGVYAIDSESWDKRLPVRTKNARQLWHGPFSKKDRLEHARWEAKQAGDRLSAELGTPIYVRPAMAVYGPQIPWTIATIRDVDVFSGGRLRKYLRRNAGMKDRPKLGAAEIEQIYAAAARVLPLNSASRRTPVG